MWNFWFASQLWLRIFLFILNEVNIDNCESNWDLFVCMYTDFAEFFWYRDKMERSQNSEYLIWKKKKKKRFRLSHSRLMSQLSLTNICKLSRDNVNVNDITSILSSIIVNRVLSSIIVNWTKSWIAHSLLGVYFIEIKFTGFHNYTFFLSFSFCSHIILLLLLLLLFSGSFNLLWNLHSARACVWTRCR